MNVIKYNVNSGDVCQIGRQYEYGKTQVIFEGYQVIDSANEIYFKFVGRTEDSKYLIPIVDMTLDITQQLTKHVGQFSCQLEEMNTGGTLVSQSPVFYVAVKRSIKVGADYEVQDPRLETIYRKYNEMYNIISQTNETSLANESQRQSEWLTLKQEVSDAINGIDGSLDTYKAETTQMLESNLAEYERQTTSNISTALKTYETQTDANLNEKFQTYSAKVSSDINRMFDDSDRTSKEKIDGYISEIEQRRIAGEFNGSDGYTPVKGKDYFTESEIVQFKKDVTPKKGIDYFTDSEISQIQNEVSSGAIGEFRAVAQTETDNFNTNAQNKTAEFDTHTEQIQTDISSLKSDVSANKSELAKTNLYLDALYKLNKGQTYDVLEQESEAYSVDVPSGSKYVGVDKVGGKSVAWNQMITSISNIKKTGGTISLSNGIATFTASESGNQAYNTWECISNHKYFVKAKFKTSSATADVKLRTFLIDIQGIESTAWQTISYIGVGNNSETLSVGIVDRRTSGFDAIDIAYFMTFDLTQMFGTTIADYIYSLEQATAGAGVEWFKKLFPADYYPYSEPTIISSQTDRVDVASADGTVTQQITTNFPALNSAGSVYDYIDLNEGKLYQRVGAVDLGEFTWTYFDDKNGKYFNTNDLILAKPRTLNLLCNKYQPSKTLYEKSDKTMTTAGWHGNAGYLNIFDSDYSDATTFKEAMSGVMLYYELAEEIITDIEIPTKFTDWLEAEAGGSVTFHNTDEGKRLLIPNKLSFVRKLDEVV